MTRRFVARHPRAAGAVLSIVGVLLGAALVIACASVVGGCSAATQQRVVSITAIAAGTADDLTATAWETGADIIAAEIEAEGLPQAERWPAFCSRAADLYQGTTLAACWARALGNTARAGQRAIDAADGAVAGPAWAKWASTAVALAAAVLDAWRGVPDQDPPDELVEIVDLLRLFAGGDLPDACTVGPIPGCGEVP